MGLPRTLCDFVCILGVIAIEFLSRTSSKELPTKAAITLNRALFVHSTHAPTLYVCAVVELRFVTERKKKKKNQAEFIPWAFPSESPGNKSILMENKCLNTTKACQNACTNDSEPLSHHAT